MIAAHQPEAEADEQRPSDGGQHARIKPPRKKQKEDRGMANATEESVNHGRSVAVVGVSDDRYQRTIAPGETIATILG